MKGIEMTEDGNYKIIDKDAYMTQVKEAYSDSNNPLNPQMESRINNHIGMDSNKVWDNRDGFPGLHAEIQSTNSLLNKGVNPSDISVSTYKVSPDKYGYQGTAFPACSNCKGILDGFVGNISTGVVK